MTFITRFRRKLGELIALSARQKITGIFQFLAQTKRNQRGKKLYQKWVANFDTLTTKDCDLIRADILSLQYKPLISILMPVYNVDEEWLRKAIESVKNQLYSNWELCIADDASSKLHIRQILTEYAAADARIKVVFRSQNGHISAASNSALELAVGEFCALLDHDDELSKHALYFVVRELNLFPETAMIYSDEDLIDQRGRRSAPKFKPDFSLDLLRSINLVTHLSVYQTHLLKRVGGFRTGFEGSQDYDLALRVVEQLDEKQIRHIPEILYHWRAVPGSVALAPTEKSYAHERARKALREHLERAGENARVSSGWQNLHRVSYELPEPNPLVSLIFQSENENQDFSPSVIQIQAKTNYQNVQIIQTSAPPGSLNLAAAAATGEVLVFLQNDLQVLEKDWLREMVSFALRPKIGAVGAKLLFANETVRHAGIVFGVNKLAGFAHRRFTNEATGHFIRAQLINNFSAVSGACLAVRRSVFNEIGGFDENSFPNELYDLDFCLRLRENGYRAVWTPYAQFIQPNDSPTEKSLKKFVANKTETSAIKLFRQKWQAVIAQDEFYNSNLTLEREDFSVAIPPRLAKPW